LYIVIKKISNTNITYNLVEGQFIFISMDYIYSNIPENYYISSELTVGQSTPHLYTLITNGNITIEFITSGDELDCKVLKYEQYPTGSQELFIDFKEYNITRRQNKSTTYIDVFQSNNKINKSENIIISIFSKNKGHIAGSDISKLSYILKYNSNKFVNGIYVMKAKIILLGFTKFVYIKEIIKCYFYIHFARIRNTIYSKTIKIMTTITYKKALRSLQEFERKEAECHLINITFDNQNKYNCSLDTNGEEIESIKLDYNINFEEDDATIISNTPIADNNMNNLEKVEDSTLFDKKLFIMDNCTTSINNEIKEFNITGIINDKEFNYTNLNYRNFKPIKQFTK